MPGLKPRASIVTGRRCLQHAADGSCERAYPRDCGYPGLAPTSCGYPMNVGLRPLISQYTDIRESVLYGRCSPRCGTGWIGDQSSSSECRFLTPSEALSVAPMHHWAQ